MKSKYFKIGFSDIGGVFIARDIQSDFHKHYAISILISFGEVFKITTADKKQDYYKAAIIQKNINYSLQTDKNDSVAFIHIVPYTEIGLRLSDSKHPVKKVDIELLHGILSEIKDWFESTENDPETVEQILNSFSIVPVSTSNNVIIDERIAKSFSIITQSEDEKLSVNTVASEVNLSVSHFNRLFKKETGLAFRRFVLHSKLIKSIYAMYEQNNLTQASFIGGFSDQAHLTRTFKKNFGIKPSDSRK